jgi:hypothetical protein
MTDPTPEALAEARALAIETFPLPATRDCPFRRAQQVRQDKLVERVAHLIVDTAQAEREWLEPWIHHSVQCERKRAENPHFGCDCGLIAALDAAPEVTDG